MLHAILEGFGFFLLYYVFVALTALLIRKCFKVPNELFRKILHTFCFLSVFWFLYKFETWYISVCITFIFALILYPVLNIVERFPWFGKLIPERKEGELKSSLIIVHIMFAVLITIFWGFLGAEYKYIIAVSVLAWGFGDAAAALIGKRFGHHSINHRLLDGKKTYEGTFAMCAVSFLVIFTATMIYQVSQWYVCLITAAAAAPVCAVVELFSHGGNDTITVPLSASFFIFAVTSLFSFIGV